MKKGLIRFVVFVLLSIVLFCGLQNILVENLDYPVNTDGITRTVKGLYAQDRNSLDVLFFGTSHMAAGVSPMEMYEAYGITGYNLATSRQPMGISYGLLKEAIKRQSPKVVVLDASDFFSKSRSSEAWRGVLDSMPLSVNKLQMILDYEKYSKTPDDIWTMVFPIIKYHTRWRELVENDFEIQAYHQTYYSKGYVLRSQLQECAYTLEQMNEMNKKTAADENVNSTNMEYLKKIKALCEKEGIELLITKIPTVNNPNEVNTAWTQTKSEAVRQICEEEGLPFFDIWYDTDFTMDYGRDSIDGGNHLNARGAEKTTALMGQYLVDHYDLQPSTDQQFETDMGAYKSVKALAMLELETDFSDYIHMLDAKKSDLLIFLSAGSGFPGNLTQEDKDALTALGVTSTFPESDDRSFIAVISGGQLLFDASGSDYIEFSPGDADSYSLCSDLHGEASIQIFGQECSYGGKGLNIVVYDQKTQAVIDRVAFDTTTDQIASHRINRETEKILKRYENYYIQNR